MTDMQWQARRRQNWCFALLLIFTVIYGVCAFAYRRGQASDHSLHGTVEGATRG